MSRTAETLAIHTSIAKKSRCCCGQSYPFPLPPIRTSTPQEIYPLLPLLLTELSKLHHRAEEVSIKNILVELCLTVPARLASLLPHLPLMMRLMVHALRCRGDLDGLALRTLEFWVDNLNPDYLYRIMSHDPRVGCLDGLGWSCRLSVDPGCLPSNG